MNQKNKTASPSYLNNSIKNKKSAGHGGYNVVQTTLTADVITRLKSYSLQQYIEDIKILGLAKTWDQICAYILENHTNLPDFLNIDNFSDLYETGVETQSKISKKKQGQYSTPDDVAAVMSKWLDQCEGESVCDVACGAGKLILTYFDVIGYENARNLIRSGRVYLYDCDSVALKICSTVIAVKYGADIAEHIHSTVCDFLDADVVLPANCKVISNPPYAKIDTVKKSWEHSAVLSDTKEMYSAFIEKIFNQATSTVIITPFSFVSGDKFFSLREQMSRVGHGFIISFDNVPGNIFCGKKHGIFNTNTANSVRASVTVMKKSGGLKGYRVSPLIRFKNEERAQLLNPTVLESTLPDNLQTVDTGNKKFEKIEKDLIEIFQNWKDKSDFKVQDILTGRNTKYFIDMPNTCRYYTTASSRKLSRKGSITMNLLSEDDFNLLYCVINSSFAYWWWRVYDGAITYPVSLLNSMPLPINLLSDDDKVFFRKTAKKLMASEKKYIVTKMNAGTVQENIKFPQKYREAINKRLLGILGFDSDGCTLNKIHKNSFFDKN